MLNYVTGDLFTSPAQTLVNTVNTEGIMGKGIALAFKRLFPEMYEEYRDLCAAGRLAPGVLHVYRAGPKIIVNFPTKTVWRRPSRPEYIEAGLKTLVANFAALGVSSIALPPLGCGNGELDFERQVQPLIERYLRDLPIPVFVYPPHPRKAAPEHTDLETMQGWLAKENNVPLSEALWEDLRELLARKREFRTLSQGTQLMAEMTGDPGGESIWVTTHGTAPKRYQFSREDVERLWESFREHLIVTPRSWVGGEREATYLLPLLAGLEYLEPMLLSSELAGLTGLPTVGVKLRPVNSPKRHQRALAL